jgi:hypothetical protein
MNSPFARGALKRADAFCQWLATVALSCSHSMAKHTSLGPRREPYLWIVPTVQTIQVEGIANTRAARIDDTERSGIPAER